MQKVRHINGKIVIPEECKVKYWDKSLTFQMRFTMGEICRRIVRSIVEFAWVQAVNNRQRPNLEDSEYIRNKWEMFCDTLEGKIGELCFQKWWESMFNEDIGLNLDSWERGEYEESDFTIHGLKYQIKTIKQFANLLMWVHGQNSIEVYSKTDFMFLCRTNIIEQFTKVKGRSIVREFLPYFDTKSDALIDKVIRILTAKLFTCEVTGFIDNDMIRHAIRRSEMLHKGEIIGTKKLRADNDYVVVSDLLTYFNEEKARPSHP